jgi:hypothetical protein
LKPTFNFFQLWFEGLTPENYKERICLQLYAEEHRLEQQIVEYDMVIGFAFKIAFYGPFTT